MISKLQEIWREMCGLNDTDRIKESRKMKGRKINV